MLDPIPISIDEVRRRQESGEEIVFLDARIPESWRHAHAGIAGALRLPPAEVENNLRWIPRGRCIVAYADAQNDYAAIRAARALVANGWDARPLQGGFQAWEQAGNPTRPKEELRTVIL